MRIDALIAALWPKAISGDIAAVGKVLDLMAREAKVIGYDSTDKVDHRIHIQNAAQQVAEQLGLDPADVLAEADRIIQSQVAV